MKNYIKLATLISIMIAVSVIMWNVTVDVIVPWLIDKNILEIGLTFGAFTGIVVWVGICEFFYKVLGCETAIKNI